MKSVDYRTEIEPYGEQHKAGRCNPATDILVTAWRRKLRLKSGHGSNDDICVFVESDSIYVLSVNSLLSYCGIARYDRSELNDAIDEAEFFGDIHARIPWTLTPQNEVFLQVDIEIEETLGARGLDLSPYTIARRLKELMQE